MCAGSHASSTGSPLTRWRDTRWFWTLTVIIPTAPSETRYRLASPAYTTSATIPLQRFSSGEGASSGASFSGRQELVGGSFLDYLYEVNGVEVPFGALSDGFRAYIGWITDLLYHVSAGGLSSTKLVDSRGIVLVDEIDLNLHPEWQRTVCSTISKVLPNLQFVFSTHSPIVAGSLEKENIFVMETEPSGASKVSQYQEGIYGLDADQVLLSPYFNLESTRAPGFVDELQELSLQAGPGKPEIALAIMQKLIRGRPPNPRLRPGRSRWPRSSAWPRP